MRSNSSGYTKVAITLHWLIAAAILINIALGAWMSGAIDEPQSRARAIDAFQYHKSLGLTVLVLSLLRLVWRLLYPPPPLPVGMAGWERGVALFTHWAFYGLMIGIPLSGWLYVSSQWRGDAPLSVTTLWFGLFEVPHLFALHETGPQIRETSAAVTLSAHELLVAGLLILLVLHVGAAIRHQFFRHDGVLARMLPGFKTSEQGSSAPAATPARRFSAAAVIAMAVGLTAIATTVNLGPQTAAVSGDMEAALQRLSANKAGAPGWKAAPGKSSIGFNGVHAGRPFNGRFQQWRAAIYFDPDAPDKSQIVAVIKTASATDGVPMHDRTLPKREWFHSVQFPHASFRSTAIRQVSANDYLLEGVLTIKTHEIKLEPLSLTVNGDALRITGEVSIDRAAVDMGMESDPAGEYVSREIGISVDVVARRL